MDTINDEIQTQIDNTIQTQPSPLKGEITKVYENNHVDIETDIGTFTYAPVIATNPQIGHFAIIIFIDGSHDDYVVISK